MPQPVAGTVWPLVSREQCLTDRKAGYHAGASHELKRCEGHKVASAERVSGLPFLCIARLKVPTEDIRVGMAGYGLENTQADPGVVCIRQARSPPRVS